MGGGGARGRGREGGIFVRVLVAAVAVAQANVRYSFTVDCTVFGRRTCFLRQQQIQRRDVVCDASGTKSLS